MGMVAGGSRVGAWILVAPGEPLVPVFGIDGVERLRRMLLRAGVLRVESGPAFGVREASAGGTWLVFRADLIYDERLVRPLISTEQTLLVERSPEAPEGSRPLAGHVDPSSLHGVCELLLAGRFESTDARLRELRVVVPGELCSPDDPALRKVEAPAVLAPRADNIAEIESRLFAASYKGVTDLVTRWVWPRPALSVTRRLARRGVRPNTVTALSWLLAALAMLLFARGAFALGLTAAWAMTFLDTVDGKLARVTVRASSVGGVLDHGLDLLHPPLWYAAWAMGCPEASVALVPATWVVVVGYVVGRLLEGAFLIRFGIEIHVWRPIDSRFRLICARRNPNLILLTVGALSGRPEGGLLAVAIWTTLTIAFHTRRLAQALNARRRGEAVQAWYAAHQAAPIVASASGGSGSMA